MDYSTHIENRDYINDMKNDADTEERIRILNRRQTIIAAQWAQTSYQLRQYQQRQLKQLQSDPYQFWCLTSKHRMVSMAVMNAHFSRTKLSPSGVARDLGYSRASISKLLKEAQKLGLLIEESGCQYKPSLDTIDGFIFYTNETMSMSEMVRLAAGVIRLNSGAFKSPAKQKHNENRISIKL